MTHSGWITGENHYQTVAAILHKREEGIDRFHAETTSPFFTQRVCLVDEQDPVEGTFHDVCRLDRRATDNIGNKICSSDLDQMSLLQDAPFVKQLADQPGDRRLPC